MSLKLPEDQNLLLEHKIWSSFLAREIHISVRLPFNYHQSDSIFPLLLVNDGQDFRALRMDEISYDLQSKEVIIPLVVIGLHAGNERISEYGTVGQPDYANRGQKADQTTAFVLKELFPFIAQNYRTRLTGIVYAGFSLGGLMALSLAWNHPEYFSRVAVFSGALWWRQKAVGEGYQDSDRIMHAQIRNAAHRPGLKFWFQTGTNDEQDDRDGDGIIDSIQDTLECIAELERKGYRWSKDIRYLEIYEGRHDTRTWSSALPEFLKWAFGRH